MLQTYQLQSSLSSLPASRCCCDLLKFFFGLFYFVIFLFFLFLFYFFFCFSFYIFISFFLLSFILFIILIFQFFSQIIQSSSIFILIFFISFGFLKQNQIKTTWSRADIVLEINSDGQVLTCSNSTLDYATQKSYIFHLCHM